MPFNDQSKKFLVVIPARYASSRLEGKPLIEICGVPLLVRTYLQCKKVLPSEKVIVATDDKRIVSLCDQHSIPVMLTPQSCLTGTDRVAYVAKHLEADIYFNVQGDEPLFNPDDLNELLKAGLKSPDTVMTGYTLIDHEKDYRSNSCPKVVMDLNNNLLYMSRSPIPGNKEGRYTKALRQVCAYSFPKKHLLSFAEYGVKSPLEESEDIEILRFLEIGIPVKMIKMSSYSIPVDYYEDIKKVENVLEKKRDLS